MSVKTPSARKLILAAVLLGIPSVSTATPVSDGLVLWLDAEDADTVSCELGAAVVQWADKSGQGNHARQIDPNSQPQYVADGFNAKVAVRFDGSDFLNLGRPKSLDFRPGDPFTIAVVYRVALQHSGTFLSKGGGAAGQRAYQLYVAPGRHGAITYGVMRESPRSSETEITVAVCDGTRSEVYANGVSCLSLRAGEGRSDVDVLVGARRANADNTGTFYPLQGDVAEILVYNRALQADELSQLGNYLKKKYALDAEYIDPDDIGKLVATLASPDAPARLDAIAAALVRSDDLGVSEIRALLEREPLAAPVVAELLLRISETNRLSSRMAELAAELLAHDDPFVRGIAEWSVAMKVGGENNPQQTQWPNSAPPPWFSQWLTFPDSRRIEADWVRQAVSQGIHRDGTRLAESVDEMIGRAERMQADWGGESIALACTAEPLSQLRAVRRQIDDLLTKAPDRLAGLRRLWIEARRQMRTIVLANPAADFEQIVFVKRFVPHTVRNITRSYAWKHKPGGDICVLSDFRTGGPVQKVIQGRLGPGYVWGLDLWWDADRVVFGYARQSAWPPAVDTADYREEGTNVFQLRMDHEPLHIFEVRLDGSEPTQLTDDPYWSDFEPTYCADGRIVFASDRCGRAAECGNDTYDHTNPNLYVMSADGSNLRQWTDSKDIDRYPHSLNDGRIAYTHWEYQERHFMEVHALWTARPDGTMSDALFKHHMPAPCGLRDTRSVPDSQKLVSIATGHHTFAYGPVVTVDPAKGMNNEEGLEIVTPGVLPQEGPMAGRPVADGGVPDRGGLYQTPWALSEKCFLAGYSYARPNCTAPAGVDSNGFALYLIDTYGNRELIHRDPLLSCVCPIPLRPRPRPPIVPDTTLAVERGKKNFGICGVRQRRISAAASRRDACTTNGLSHAPKQDCPTEDGADATCYVTDVYRGMDDIPRGTIRYLRISQHVGWPFDSQRGQMDYIPGNAGTRRIDFQSWSPVRVIGTVPVERDGSASFKVPADTAVYFQALDNRHMEIRRMRSVVSFKAGEVRGCTGCHESRAWTTAGQTSIPAAMRREPDKPVPPPWGSERLLGYGWLVQPTLDQHCVRCHGREEPDGGLDLTATVAEDGLYQSYRTMFGQLPGQSEPGCLLVSCSDRFSNGDVTVPKQFGSHKSPLVRVLLDDPLHRDEVSLDPRQWLALVTWVDANAPYHDAFFDKRPADGGRPRRDVTPRLSDWTAPLAQPGSYGLPRQQ